MVDVREDVWREVEASREYETEIHPIINMFMILAARGDFPLTFLKTSLKTKHHERKIITY